MKLGSSGVMATLLATAHNFNYENTEKKVVEETEFLIENKRGILF